MERRKTSALDSKRMEEEDKEVFSYFSSLKDADANEEDNISISTLISEKISPLEFELEGQRETALELAKLKKFTQNSSKPQSFCYRLMRKSLLLFWYDYFKFDSLGEFNFSDKI